MCTPRTAIRSPASLRRLLSTGNCSSVSHHSGLRRRSSTTNDNNSNNNNNNNKDANPSRDGSIDGSGILSFNKVKVGKRKFEMTGPTAGVVQQRMQERMRQRNEL